MPQIEKLAQLGYDKCEVIIKRYHIMQEQPDENPKAEEPVATPKTTEEMFEALEIKEDQNLRRLFIFDKELPEGRLQRIAEDAIVLYNKNGEPLQIARISKEGFDALMNDNLRRIPISGDIPKNWPTRAPKPVELKMTRYDDVDLQPLERLHRAKTRAHQLYLRCDSQLPKRFFVFIESKY